MDEASEEDDSKKGDSYHQMFQQFSEEGQGDDGLPNNTRIMNKAGLKKMSAEMLKIEKKLNEEETTAYMK